MYRPTTAKNETMALESRRRLGRTRGAGDSLEYRRALWVRPDSKLGVDAQTQRCWRMFFDGRRVYEWCIGVYSTRAQRGVGWCMQASVDESAAVLL